jgi:hypothetical protein
MIPDSVNLRPEYPETTERLVTKKDALCAGVELLLKRMESNPEEFAPYSGKWKDITNSIEQYGRGGTPADLTFLTEHERSTLWEKYCEARKKHLHHSVMERILVSDDTAHINTPLAKTYKSEPYIPGRIVEQAALYPPLHPALAAVGVEPYTPEDKAAVKLSLTEMLKKKLNSL